MPSPPPSIPPSLADQTVLVAGGAGAVGQGIVRGLLAAGATVAVPSRDEARLAALDASLAPPVRDRLVTLLGTVGTPDGAAAVRDQLVARLGRVDHAVASLGGRWAGPPLPDLSVEAWRRVLDESLTAHFVAARTFLPLVAARPGGSYTFVVSPAGETPVAGSTALSVATAGLMMLTRAFAQELRHTGVRVNEVMVYPPTAGPTAAPAGDPAADAEPLTPDEVGAFVAFLASPGAHASPETIRLPSRAARDAAVGWLKV